MSIAVAVKVNDGFAIAADSATTLADADGHVWNIYNNANKIVNLVKGLPIGMMFWDAGSIGPASMATIAKDVRLLLTRGSEDGEWMLDPDHYTMVEVAEKVYRYVYENRYLVWHDPDAGEELPSIGMHVCGFGAYDDTGREFEINIQKDGTCAGPVELAADRNHNLIAFASPDPVARLVVGVSSEIVGLLMERGFEAEEALELYQALANQMHAGLVHPAMPIRDAAELAQFLVHTAVMYYRFRAGDNTVGGPIEVAAITKHEGFKWIDRKLYYGTALNPD